MPAHKVWVGCARVKAGDSDNSYLETRIGYLPEGSKFARPSASGTPQPLYVHLVVYGETACIPLRTHTYSRRQYNSGERGRERDE